LIGLRWPHHDRPRPIHAKKLPMRFGKQRSKLHATFSGHEAGCGQPLQLIMAAAVLCCCDRAAAGLRPGALQQYIILCVFEHLQLLKALKFIMSALSAI
jgi:hypothetical protein